MDTKEKKKARTTPRTPRQTRPSATAREIDAVDDEAVSRTVNVPPAAEDKGTRSVLPGPPIPPKVQDKIRKEKRRHKRFGGGE